MSTFETDAYWQGQQTIVENYATMVKSMKDPALHQALQGICNNPEVHERTKNQCRAIYNTWKDQFDDVGDPNIQYQQYVIDKERDEAERAEQHYAPSEGFRN